MNIKHSNCLVHTLHSPILLDKFNKYISTNELYEEDDLKDDLPDEGPGVLLRPDFMNTRGSWTYRVTHKDWDFRDDSYKLKPFLP